MRHFTDTGMSPALATAAAMMARSRLGFSGMADPPPLRVILGAGQPKLRSRWSTRPSPTRRRVASATSAGSVA
ncbi:MAG: hypothetical protein R2755_07465 [Acidimicrobiales bacterium]